MVVVVFVNFGFFQFLLFGFCERTKGPTDIIEKIQLIRIGWFCFLQYVYPCTCSSTNNKQQLLEIVWS